MITTSEVEKKLFELGSYEEKYNYLLELIQFHEQKVSESLCFDEERFQRLKKLTVLEEEKYQQCIDAGNLPPYYNNIKSFHAQMKKIEGTRKVHSASAAALKLLLKRIINAERIKKDLDVIENYDKTTLSISLKKNKVDLDELSAQEMAILEYTLVLGKIGHPEPTKTNNTQVHSKYKSTCSASTFFQKYMEISNKTSGWFNNPNSGKSPDSIASNKLKREREKTFKKVHEYIKRNLPDEKGAIEVICEKIDSLDFQ